MCICNRSSFSIMNSNLQSNCRFLIVLLNTVCVICMGRIRVYTNYMSMCFMFQWYIRATFKQTKNCIEITKLNMFNKYEFLFTAKKTEHLIIIKIIRKNCFKYFYVYTNCAPSDHNTCLTFYTHKYEES